MHPRETVPARVITVNNIIQVNLAARLMMHYPGVVSCDRDTFEDSKLSMDLFNELPYKEMKGCAKTQVFQYQEGISSITCIRNIEPLNVTSMEF